MVLPAAVRKVPGDTCICNDCIHFSNGTQLEKPWFMDFTAVNQSNCFFLMLHDQFLYLQVVHTVGGNQPVLGNAVKTKECSLKVH